MLNQYQLERVIKNWNLNQRNHVPQNTENNDILNLMFISKRSTFIYTDHCVYIYIYIYMIYIYSLNSYSICCFCSVVMSNSLWPHGLQNARLPYPSLFQNLLKFTFIESMMLSNPLILCHPLLLLPSNLSQCQGLFPWVDSWSSWILGSSASASILPMNSQG